MKYIQDEKSFAILIQDHNGEDIVLWKTDVINDTSFRMQDEPANWVILKSSEGYIPVLLGDDFFMFFKTVPDLSELEPEPIVFFSEKDKRMYFQDGKLKIETSLNETVKEAVVCRALDKGEIPEQNIISTIILNDKNSASAYEITQHFSDSNDCSHVTDYYNSDLEHTDTLFFHNKKGRIRFTPYNINKWNEYLYKDFLDLNISEKQYVRKTLDNLYVMQSYMSPNIKKAFLIIGVLGACFGIKACSQREKIAEQDKTPAIEYVFNNQHNHQ